MGVGAARRMSNVNWSVVKELVLTWVFIPWLRSFRLWNGKIVFDDICVEK